jgi:hypothetical protein
MVPGELFLMDGFQEGDPCPEDRRQKTDDRRQTTEDRRQKTEER